MKQSIDYIWSTCAGMGSWNASGTMGSIVGLLVYYIFSFLPSFLHFIVLVGFIVYSIIASAKIAHSLNRHDPSVIISDEVVGMWLCLWIIEPTQIASAIIAFIIFRVLDISKFGPVAWAEKLPGGLGIVADDLVAGMMSAFCMIILNAISI